MPNRFNKFKQIFDLGFSENNAFAGILSLVDRLLFILFIDLIFIGKTFLDTLRWSTLRLILGLLLHFSNFFDFLISFDDLIILDSLNFYNYVSSL